jgi:hypothetical protein
MTHTFFEFQLDQNLPLTDLMATKIHILRQITAQVNQLLKEVRTLKKDFSVSLIALLQ